MAFSEFRRRVPEILVLLLGVALRFGMSWSFPPDAGYDFTDHWAYVVWIAREGTLPPLEALRLANHPPLFYALGAGVVHLGGGPRAVQAISVAAGIARLGLVWLGLEVALPRARLARLVGLALAAVLPVAVQIDGTVGGESLCATLVAAALVLVPAAFGDGRRGLAAWALIGSLLGLALLTKVSALTVVVALAVGVVARPSTAHPRPARTRSWMFVPALVGLLAFFIATGWYFAWNQARYGKPVVTGFDAPGLRFMPATNVVPIVFRRSPEFYLGWSAEIYAAPYYPSASLGHARFFPLLLASTFVDYYNHSFAPVRAGVRAILVNGRSLPVTALALGRVSVVAGTVIALVTVAAWAAALATTYAARDRALFTLLLVPLAAVAGQAYYALVYPHDWLGVVKGAYVLYGATPLFGTFGLGVAWLAGRSRSLAVVPLAALAAVGAYTVWCRVV